MATNTPPSASAEPGPTTEAFQKHYGRGAGYPDEYPPYPHHGHHPQSYHPSHYGAPPPLPPHAGGHPPPPPHGYHHHPPTWYYPPHTGPNGALPPPPHHPGVPLEPEEAPVVSTSRRSSKRPAAKKKPSSNNMPPSLVTPKSNDSESLPPLHVPRSANKSTPPRKEKPAGPKTSIKRHGLTKASKASISKDQAEPGIEELKVEPMKQDFHFYAMDHFEEVKQVCQEQIDNSNTDVPKEKQLYLLTTLLNTRLIQNWENASPATRAAYMKKEEADRKRFMSAEEVASRHCATLTARRRSPKQSNPVTGLKAESFGLTSTLEIPSLPGVAPGGSKRMIGGDYAESSAKRARTAV